MSYTNTNTTNTNTNQAFPKNQFKGVCFTCGQWGHAGKDCPNKNQEYKANNQGVQRNCTYCT